MGVRREFLKMPLYGAVLALRPELSDEERDLLLKGIEEVIVNEKGEVKDVNLMGMQRFAYEIGKGKEGFFITIDFHFDSSKVDRIREFFSGEKRIVRAMITRKKISPEKKREGKGGGQVESNNLNRESHPRS